jgi:hypothetical protein
MDDEYNPAFNKKLLEAIFRRVWKEPGKTKLSPEAAHLIEFYITTFIKEAVHRSHAEADLSQMNIEGEEENAQGEELSPEQLEKVIAQLLLDF